MLLGTNALRWAALNDFASVVQYIIGNGVKVNATDNLKQTALHWAAIRGSVAAAHMLLQNGAWVEASDMNGNRVLTRSLILVLIQSYSQLVTYRS
ncbi:hypothetical protein ACJRO7_036032 [Eucalyptus globulus]|uniref:Uncharacterized protein n=1 Tax=Eucalyptus globulus TaxID=34317 RepID=A0ABD3JDN7_EUCGL